MNLAKLLQDGLLWKTQMSTWPWLPSTVIAARQRMRNSFVHSSSILMSEQGRLGSEEDTLVRETLMSHYALLSVDLASHSDALTPYESSDINGFHLASYVQLVYLAAQVLDAFHY